MPISDNSNYPSNHFTRVYEHLIIPACKIANFIPIRADDVINTNYIAIDVIKKIIESEMVLCDLSSQNPNVLYELGIRQAFNKPVTLIKDRITKRIFDIQGFRDFEYDETLRVDNVQNDVDKLSQILTSTYNESSDDINSLVSLLGLRPARIINNTEISNETKLILNSISNIESRITSIENQSFNIKTTDYQYITTKIPDNIGDELTIDELLQLNKGDYVYHDKFGYGEILSINKPNEGSSKKIKGLVKFQKYGVKELLFHYAKLRLVIN